MAAKKQLIDPMLSSLCHVPSSIMNVFTSILSKKWYINDVTNVNKP